jgi:nucleotide-binding universal stress UspA family protein
VAVDGSPESEAALRTAEALARGAGADLRLITVVEPVPPPASDLTGLDDTVALMHDVARVRQGELDEAAAALPHEVTAHGVLREGEARDELEAESEALDLLVLGSRGYGPARSVLLGGVSLALARRAACPSVVVPRGGTAPFAAGVEASGTR